MSRFRFLPLTVSNLADPLVATVQNKEVFFDSVGNMFYKNLSGTIIPLINVSPNPIFDFGQVTNLPATLLEHGIDLSELDKLIEKENKTILLKEDFYKNTLTYTYIENTTPINKYPRLDIINRNLLSLLQYIPITGSLIGMNFGKGASNKTLFSTVDGVIRLGVELTIVDTLSATQNTLDYSTNRLIIGMTNTPSFASINTLFGSFFEINTTNNMFMMVNVSTALNETTVDTDIEIQSNTKYWLVIESSVTETKFYIDNVLKGTINTNLNNSYLNPNVYAYSISNTSGLCISKMCVQQVLSNENTNVF